MIADTNPHVSLIGFTVCTILAKYVLILTVIYLLAFEHHGVYPPKKKKKCAIKIFENFKIAL
jgi:hypothetical protein